MANMPEAGKITGINIAPARFVTIELASVCTGLSVPAIRTRIARGVWVEGREYVRKDGRVFIDLQGYERWVMLGSHG